MSMDLLYQIDSDVEYLNSILPGSSTVTEVLIAEGWGMKTDKDEITDVTYIKPIDWSLGSWMGAVGLAYDTNTNQFSALYNRQSEPGHYEFGVFEQNTTDALQTQIAKLQVLFDDGSSKFAEEIAGDADG